MIWMTWRQHRQQVLFVLIGMVAVSALILPTGLRMHDVFTDSGLADCLRRTGDAEFVTVGPGSNDCAELANQFLARFGNLQPLAVLFAVLPLLVGLFLGAPLVAREVELGTHRLVWTQGVSRLRWAMIKFGLIGTGCLAIATAYTLLLSWWIRPLNGANGSRFTVLIFDQQGIVPIGYTLFAVALGIFAGTVSGKVMPAMATTLVGFLAVRLLVAGVARPHFQAQRERKFPVTSQVEPNQLNGDWIIHVGIYNSSGVQVAANQQRSCRPESPSPSPSATPAGPTPEGCEEGLYNLQIYQPGSRFWLFQTIETGIFVALAAVLVILAVYRVRRRIS
ncbi:hypothetical protein EV643_11290 [Kribbella sp. VKM Ac-2527]|uniref:ABC-2 family transporter n=1 Tax=Kribbella caucasensis TaxID=2512215 RepID=A0A4R6KBT1_9ACTN|nr:transporter [Kribbella sp. VKM Ac-2527]TDO45766.1 hypothetical protein EV643_11290 [Kribbella sp. VKM Ac-2527]